MLQEERAMRIKAIRNRIRQIKVSGSIRPMDKDKLSHIAQQYNRLKGAEGTPAKKVRITRKESSAGGETRSITGSINGSSCITLETWDYNGNLISDYYGYVSDYDGCFVCLGIDMGYISNYLGVSANDIIGIAIEIFAYTFGNDIGYEVYIDDILEHIEPEIIDGYIYFPVFTEGESQKDGVEIWPLSNYDGEIYFDAYDIEVHYLIRSPLTSIAIETEPAKIRYNEGEQFDPAGMVVKAYYSDGTSQTITDYNYSPGGALTPGDREIIVSYQGKTTTQEIMVFSLSPDEPDYKQTYIDGKTGERVGYVTNPRNGRVDFAVDVLSLGGSLAPMSLNLVYNPYYRGYSFEKNFSEGWKLNVEQFIYLSGSDYIYVDENYRQHIFRKLVSDGSVYYDTEHTGLLLRIISGAKKITDDRGNELLFDSSGYLTTIKTTKGQNPITTVITYDGSHKLTSITDGMGRTATVNDSLITAPSGLKISAGRGGITYFRGIAPNETVIETLTFSYKCGSLIERVVSSSGDKAEFEYNGKAISVITESVNDNVRKVKEFTYHQYKGVSYYTEVKNSVYVDAGLSSQISRAYISTGDGHALLQNEVRNAADRQRLMSFRFASIEDYERLTLNLNPKKNAYGQEYGARDGFFSELDDVEDSESLVFYAVLDCDEFFDDNGSVTIGLWDITTSNHLEGTELTFTGAMHGIKVLSKKVNIDGYSVNNIWYYVEENGYDIFSNFSPEAVHLCYSPRIKQGNCVQGSFGPNDLRYTEHGANTNTIWSLLEKCTLYESNVEKGKLTASDIALNEENAARASANSSFIVWFEDLSKAILSNSGEVKCNDEENNISLASARFGILTIEETKNTFSHRAFGSGNNFIVTTINENRDNASKVCKIYQDGCYNTVKTEDSYGVTTNNYYDTYGRLTGSSKAASGLVLENEKIYGNIDLINMEYTETEIDENGNSTGITFDYNSSNVKRTTDGMNNTHTYSYDVKERLSQITHGNANQSFTYGNQDLVTNLSDGRTDYSFAYTGKKDIESVDIDSNTILTNDYSSFVNIVTTTYATDYCEYTEYDNYGNTVQIAEETYWLDDPDYLHGIQNFIYGSASGNTMERSEDEILLKKTFEDVNGWSETEYNYDEKKRLTKRTVKSIDVNSGYVEEYEYGSDNEMVSKVITVGQAQYNFEYTYDKGDALNGMRKQSMSFDCGDLHQMEQEYLYDALGRLIKVSMEGSYESVGDSYHSREYTYATNAGNTTSQIATLRSVFGYDTTRGVGEETFTDNITYDGNGNITEIAESGLTNHYRYYYDSLNRLIREDNPAFDKTFRYEYDDYGNIVKKTECNYNQTTGTEKSYAYAQNSWRDRLTSFNGQTITYDASGNPETYMGKTMEWERGRQMMKCETDNTHYSEYDYDMQGVRLKKYVVNGNLITTSKYYYDNNRLLREKRTGFNAVDITFIYDGDEIIGFSLGMDDMHYYRKNIFGDIVGIYAVSGEREAEYAYDAWGNCIVYDANRNVITPTSAPFNVGIINPIRYRGYYYDNETQLFYCNSRYYSPELCRFISPDSIEYLDPESINGLNLYAYCYNNPIMYSDPSGHFVITLSAVLWAAAIGAAIGAVSGAVYGGITAAANGQNVWAGIGIGALTGGFMGAGAGIASLFIAPVLVGEGVMVATATGAGFVMGNALSAGAALAIGTGIAFGSGAIGGAASDMLTQVANTGKVSDWNSVGFSALQWGLINTAGAFLGSVGGPLSNLETALVSGMLGNVTGLIGLTADVIRGRNNKRKQRNNLSYMYSYGF